MTDCCDPLAQVKQKRNTLITVLLINAAMFFIQFIAALIGHSTALLADSLDMLGDALAYIISLYAVNKAPVWLARAALIKGCIIAVFGVGVFVEVIIKIFFFGDALPQSLIMGIFSSLGLLANGFSFYLLTRHRNQDINMNSAWICARNDMLANMSVLITAGLIIVFHSRWPDIIIGLLLASVLLVSAIRIIRKSILHLRKNSVSMDEPVLVPTK